MINLLKSVARFPEAKSWLKYILIGHDKTLLKNIGLILSREIPDEKKINQTISLKSK